MAKDEHKPTAYTTAREHVATLAELELKFERALSTLYMAFQPIVRASDTSVFGFEALMRPNDPDLPHPGAMLDAAERLHRLPQLGRTVRTLAAQAFASQPRDYGALFVNCHALDLTDRALVSRFTPLSRIADRVVLEITERASLSEIDDARYRVAELRELGFRIAIDDLGAGHERMSRFEPADTDIVKLDISLVRDIDRHPVKQQLARSIAQLCRDNGILVIGEGVESASEADALSELGCDLLQGYHFARPGPDFPLPRAG